ncbi:MAG: glucose PTS transporter subunit IIA [Oscillospiraceae bacterium]|nr:glucose PTS transporter subunit IIA [Oscillospiraceae bacterium]
MKDNKAFEVLQRVGRSFMLPIAILPVAGLFLGIGSSFTNETMLRAYGLYGVMGPGTVIHGILTVMSAAGTVVFDNLPLLFAIGVAIGMAKREKEVAALASVIAFFIMHTAISALISVNYGSGDMSVDTLAQASANFEQSLNLSGATSLVLGIYSLNMGVFGGIIVGLGTAALHNRFYKIQLPQMLSFFGGTRFVPIISAVVFLIVGIIMFFIWPYIQKFISLLGNLVQNTGYVGTLIYGIIERALIPFGLHHVFYMPFWQTNVGGSMEVAGQVINGAQNIFFAQLADPNTTEFSVNATRFMAGKFPFMIFGLPGAALAIYKCARKEKKKAVGGLLLSAALTSMLTGITEPLEFTFLFVAPVLYIVHCVLAGLSFMLMHIFNVGVGMTFSGGLIDMTLFGVLQGNAKTNWIYIILVGIVYFFIYWGLFTFLIKKFNFKTPGREADNEETKLYTRADVNARKERRDGDRTSALILCGLGGKDNISDVDCCATRLRITVNDSSKVDEAPLKESGAAGVIRKGNGVQVIYGPRVTVIKSNLEDFMDSAASDNLEDYDLSPDTIETERKTAPMGGGVMTVTAPVKGKAIALENVDDEVFSAGMLGKGIAVEPSEGKIFAPVDGVIDNIPESRHAIGITADNDANILIHVGIDTVKLNGRNFDLKVEEGAKIKKGDLLMTFDLNAIKKSGYKTTTPIVICNSDDFADINILADGDVNVGDDIMDITKN